MTQMTPAERDYFDPRDPDFVTCDICGEKETPADLTPDWNGETGCHLSCEADEREDEQDRKNKHAGEDGQ